MNPQEMLELQHKVSILEAENKRLQVSDINMLYNEQFVIVTTNMYMYIAGLCMHTHAHTPLILFTQV